MTRPMMPWSALGAREPAERRLDRLLERQALAHVEHGRVAHLDVAHAVARGILGQLVRDALERLRRVCITDSVMANRSR